MFLRPFATLAFLVALATPALAQSSLPAFEAADVHPAPRRSYPFFFAVLLKQDRYVARDATMVDLISTAYGVNAEDVQGGPSWLERDRFDIIARAPSGTSKDALKLMLRNVLKERFQLTFHDGTRSMPAYVLSSVKPKLKQSGGDESKCDDKSPPYAGPTSLIHVACTNMTMDNFVHELHDMAGGYLDKPVVNSTGLQGAWDFDIRWTNRGDLEKAGPDAVSIFDAVEKQLGLKLTLQTAPRPVMLVDTVSETPKANAPGIEKILPPTSAPQFEVATIKPSQPGEHGSGRISGGVVNFTNIRLKDMIDLAWDLNENDSEVLVNAPKWVNDDRYDILAKVSRESSGTSASGGSGDLPMDIYEVQLMLQALLIERFQIKAHMEDRPISSYVLTAANPKLKPADSTTRTVCKEGPGPDGKDPRLTNPILNRLLTCQNMTLQQIGDELQRVASGYIYNPVLDQTGLKGSYDFTLSFSSAGRVLPSAGASSSTTSSEPSGALSIFDAVNHQLGLKLEKQKRPLPVLVIDHIEERPTEN